MAGLVAAARARELGAKPVVLEKGDRAGGSMLLSSGVVWRYRSLEDFQAECPGGDPVLQRVIIDRLDEALEWLGSFDAPTVENTGNPRTIGQRFQPRTLTTKLANAVGHVQLNHVQGTGPGTGLEGPVVLATGGFPVRLARERGLLLRANRWSEGDGLDFALAGSGDKRFEGEPSWSETDLVQAIAGWPGGLAWYRVLEDRLGERVRERTVAEMIEAARTAGAVVREEPPFTSVLVQASVTQTLGGLRIDEQARVVGATDLYAAGADVGGISTGGYSSGLAAALVLGRIAAEEALS
jgi:hypothetical protein